MFKVPTQTPQNTGPENRSPQQKRSLILITLVIVVLVALASWQLYRIYHKSPAKQSNSSSQNSGQNQPQQVQDPRPPRQFAPAGQLADGLNKNLLSSGYAVTESYKRPFENDTMQYVAEYDSQKSVKQLYDFYKGYFASNGFEVTNQNFDAKISNLYGVKDKLQVNVVIEAAGAAGNKNNHVIVNYLEYK